jgi:thymidylate synthase ThyX
LSKLYTDNKNSFTIGETPSESEKTWRNGFKQFLFSESPSLTDKSADKIANDYIQSYKNVWLNPDKTVIKI